MTEQFKELVMSNGNQLLLTKINKVIQQFQGDGYTLTLRQLYYQLVSKNIIANNDKEYKKISRILKEGRLAGLVDWSAIEDRLRQLSAVQTWENPKQVLRAAKNSFKYNRLQDQEIYLEVWVEKDALSQVVERAANAYQVPVMVNRGYGSISSMYDTYVRFWNKFKGQHEHERAVILYLGDHDPSGLDMVRDIQERLAFFLQKDDLDHLIEVKHIALTMSQIQQYQPPPNPAKITDTRAGDYIARYGATSWEVDALDPPVLNQLITDEIEQLLDLDKYNDWKEKEAEQISKIEKFIKSFKD